MELSEFLLARIAEDEDRARTVLADHDPALLRAGSDFRELALSFTVRVLAECEAKRRIVEEHGTGSDPCDHAYDTSMMGRMCMTLRLLALPYADHNDYREEWRP